MRGAGDPHGCIIDSFEAARALFAPAFDGAREERLQVAHLDGAHRLIGFRIHYASPGQPVDVSVRTIVAEALGLDSVSLIVAHNHPSGDATPSATDLETTRHLIQATRPVGISLRDHLIFGGDRVTSFRESGLL